MPTHPTLFVSHGSPMLAIQDSPARRFLQQLGATLPRPQTILAISAHWESMGAAAVSLAERPDTIHDFGGFPEALYALQYPAPGAPAMAERASTLLEQAGFAVKRNGARGLDHGAWVPLRLMYPDADIPTAQLSVMRGATPAEHERMGRALAGLREEGVLIVGSGSMTHNLYELGGRGLDAPAPPWVSEFGDWMEDKLNGAVGAEQRAALLAYREQAPFAARNHPSEEHLMPLFVALGAAGATPQAELLHHSVEHGLLTMDMVAFS